MFFYGDRVDHPSLGEGVVRGFSTDDHLRRRWVYVLFDLLKNHGEHIAVDENFLTGVE